MRVMYTPENHERDGFGIEPNKLLVGYSFNEIYRPPRPQIQMFPGCSQNLARKFVFFSAIMGDALYMLYTLYILYIVVRIEHAAHAEQHGASCTCCASCAD